METCLLFLEEEEKKKNNKINSLLMDVKAHTDGIRLICSQGKVLQDILCNYISLKFTLFKL